MTRLHCDAEALFALSTGEISGAEEDRLRAHLDSCAQCQAGLEAAQQIAFGIAALRDVECSDDLREKSWNALGRQVDASVAKLQRRRALSVLWGAFRLRWAVVMAVVCSAAIVSAYLLSHEDTPAEQRRGIVGEQTPAAHTAMARPTPAINPPARIVTTERKKPRPGIERLACGAELQKRSAVITVVRDRKDGATLRLDTGTLIVRLPPSSSKKELVVMTAEAQTIVRGTRFSVTRNPDSGTRVLVHTGRVQVEPVGRPQQVLFLEAGQDVTIPLLSVYLQQLLLDLDAAIHTRQFDAAEKLAQRYLASAVDEDEIAAVQLRQSGILRRLGRDEEALALCRRITDGGGDAASRENALAMMAIMHAEAGHGAAASSTWRELLDRFPDGIHSLEALSYLVEETCGENSPDARALREQLSTMAGESVRLQRLVRRCAYAQHR